MAINKDVLAEVQRRGLLNKKPAIKAELERRGLLQAPAAATPPPTEEPFNMPLEAAKTALEVPLQAAGKAVQGVRGLGVAAQRVLENRPEASPLEAGLEAVPGVGTAAKAIRTVRGMLKPGVADDTLQRAAAATQPGYQPKKGEKLGAIAGPAALLAPLGVPAAIAATGITRAGESLNEGKDLGQAAQEGATDALITAGTAGTLKVAGNLGTAAFRNILAKGKGLNREAVDFVLDNPEVKRAVGSDKSAAKAINELKSTLVSAKKVAGEKIGALRKSLGLKTTLQEAEEAILKEVEPRPLKAIIEDVNQLQDLAQKGGKFNDPRNLERFLKLKQELRDVQQFSAKSVDPRLQLRDVDDALLSQKVNEIDDLIETIPDGSKLARLQQEYSDVLTEFKDFAQKLNTPGEAEQALQQIVKQGKGLTGRLKNMVEAIRKTEATEKTGKLKTALAEAGKRLFNTSQGEGLVGAGIEALEKTISRPGVKAIARFPDVVGAAAKPTQAIAALLARQFTGEEPETLSQALSQRKKEKRRD